MTKYDVFFKLKKKYDVNEYETIEHYKVDVNELNLLEKHTHVLLNDNYYYIVKKIVDIKYYKIIVYLIDDKYLNW